MTRVVRMVAGNLLVFAALVVAAEGLASLALFVRSTHFHPVFSERSHTAYDPELGWVNLPNQRLADFYKPGASLTTNNRGFRGTSDTAVAVPPGKRRVICSGDSFTLGSGVDDADTWCQRLAAHDAAWEPVNMGQGGYGLDQAFLWYQRDGTPLEHHVHVLAFITDDFRRMSTGDFGGYAKPWLALHDGRLVARNTPVPTASYGAWSWLVRNAPLLQRLRSVELLSKVAGRLGGGGEEGALRPEWLPAGQRAIVTAMLEVLVEQHRDRGRRLLVAHLPTGDELAAGSGREWTSFFLAEQRRLGFEFEDFFPAFEALTPDGRRSMFIGDEVPYNPATGHFSVAGNAFVAARIADLLSQPLATAVPQPPVP